MENRNPDTTRAPDTRHIKRRRVYADEIGLTDLQPAARLMASRLKKGKTDIGNRTQDHGETTTFSLDMEVPSDAELIAMQERDELPSDAELAAKSTEALPSLPCG